MKWMPIMGTGLAVRMDLLYERQAQLNHDQSLDRLAERGGVSVAEALYLTERGLWVRGRQNLECFLALAERVENKEIERLRALNGALCDKSNGYLVENARLAEENERLLGALNDIAHTMNVTATDKQFIEHLRGVARDALESKQ